MRISTLLFFFCLFSLVAGDLYPQQAELSLELRDVTLKKAISEIESTSDYVFLITDEAQLELNKRTNLSANKESIHVILEELLKDTNLGYSVVERQVSVYKSASSKAIETPVIKKEEIEQQKKNVTGKVTDEYGDPIIGANIIEQGTTNGTVTDIDGNFSLQVEDNAILHISYIGYLPQQVNTTDKVSVNLTLREDTKSLDELVVVGYGTQRRRDVTGSVTTISHDKLEKLQVASASEALAGMSAGVQVNTISGRPGAPASIRVRGVGSITAGNEPLYVIDGFPIESGDALSNFSTNDIESIAILKDAAATAIYGSRGANGVIIISTKRGEEGPARVSLDSYIGFSQLTHKLDLLSPEEYVQFAIDAVNKSWEYLGNDPNDPFENRPSFYQVPPYFLEPDKWTRTDWQDEIYQTAPIQNHQLTITGGNKNIRYKVAGGYFGQEGIIKTSDFNRYTIGTNIDSNLSDRLRLSLGLNYSKINKQEVEGTGQWNDGVAGTVIGLPGFYGLRNEDGSYPSHAGMGYNTSAVRNPMIFLNEYERKIYENRTLGNISAEYDLMKGLYFKTLLGFDSFSTENNFFRNNMTFSVPESSTSTRTEFKGIGSYSSFGRFDWLSENTLHYNVDIRDDHKLNFLLGFTAQKAVRSNSYIAADNFPDNFVKTLNAGQVSDGSTTRDEWSMLSYLSRVNYAYKDKYFTTLTMRRDGSSRFGRGNKWGYFPSASAGWIISEEDFLKGSSILNYLKLKLSYGVSGNDAIPNYGSIGLLSSINYVIGDNITPGQIAYTLPNDGLGWETSKQFNGGLEFGFFNNRIQLNAEAYQTINDNLLLNVPVPNILGVNRALQNIGKVRNRGMELHLTTRNIVGTFNWTSDFNISFNRNIVLELGPEDTPIQSTSNQLSHITQVGRPIGDFYGYIFEGVYNTQEEINSRPSLPTDRPGDPIVRDVNGDGEITVEDRTIIGNYQPDFYYGFNNTFSYKNFDLSILMQGVQGADVMSLIFRQVMPMTGRTNAYGLARERWRSPEEPGNGKIFAASIDVRGVRRDPSTFYMQDASFLRIRNITLGYTLPTSLSEKIKLQNARIYLTSQNPFTFTKYIGYNPEVSTYHNALTPGVDYLNYPLAKSFTIGMNLTF